MENGQALHASPYAVQIEKFADSLTQISHTFMKMEKKKDFFTGEEVDGMFGRVKDGVCQKCEKCAWCWGEDFVHTYQMGYEVLSAVDSYGSELNMEIKRKLAQRCVQAPRYLRRLLNTFQEAKQDMMWKNRMAQSREGCAIQLDTFAEMLRETSKELEDSLVEDERTEKRLTAALKKKGIRVLNCYFFMNRGGKYEIHLTARTTQEKCVTMKEVLEEVSGVIGRQMVAAAGQGQTVGREYVKIVCLEGPAYRVIQGVARVGKGGSQVSGDNFLACELPGGRQAIALSDGMGSGEKACRESAQGVELLEELLAAGFPEKMAIQMINTTLVMGREEIHYSTVDMGIFDLYRGTCEFVKAGASSTFIKRKDGVERLTSTSLPIGVVHKIELESTECQLGDGDFVVMMTDGVLDALPVAEQDVILSTIIGGSDLGNPRELAQHILKQVMNWTGEAPQDDMTVLVAGVWRR